MANEVKKTPAEAPSSSTREKKKRRRSPPLVSPPPITPVGAPDDKKKKKKKEKKPDKALGSEKTDEEARSAEDREAAPIEANPEKKPTFDRIWSEGNEIKLLEALIRCRKERGVDPGSSVDLVDELFRDNLNLPFNRNQVYDKVRRLKRRWEFAYSKLKNNRREPAKAHDKAVFELSRQIWKTPDPAPVKSESGGYRHLQRLVEELAKENESSEPSGLVLMGFKRLSPTKLQELDQTWKAHLIQGMKYSLQEKAIKRDILRACVESLDLGEH
ncbi:uncharacterized protein LOC144712316 [Wolffia australiana]